MLSLNVKNPIQTVVFKTFSSLFFILKSVAWEFHYKAHLPAFHCDFFTGQKLCVKFKRYIRLCNINISKYCIFQ